MFKLIKAASKKYPHVRNWTPATPHADQPQPLQEDLALLEPEEMMEPELSAAVAQMQAAPPEEVAGHVILEAQAKAYEKMVEAESEAKLIRKRAYDEAFLAGKEAAQQELEAKRTELATLLEEVEAERVSFFDRMEPEVARLSITIAEKVIARQLEVHPETVVDLVKNAMRRMQERETLRVRLNPDDVPIVRAAREDLLSEINGVQKLELIDDRRVGRGGCVVESNNGVLDARIKTQLEEMERVIEEAATRGKAPSAE